jgi:plasmid stabilization system protein ParE
VRVAFGKRARAQLERIHDHIAKDNPRAAAELVHRIEGLAGLLGDFPDLGRQSSRISRLRWIAVTPYPYLIFYAVRPGEVRIVRVLHGARQRHSP